MKGTLTPHPYRKNGHHYTVNGDTWSLVDLSQDPEGGDAHVLLWENIGKRYDKMGGRFEGYRRSDGDIIRAASFEELKEKIDGSYETP